MRRALVLVTVVVLAALSGCDQFGTGVTISGTLAAYYFDITSDVTVTITAGETSFTVQAPLASGGFNGEQLGAFLVAGVPTGTYAVTVTFENSYDYTGGTQFSLNGGAWTLVDGEVVTGTSAPYTFTITIDSLTIEADTTIDVDFGNVG